MKRHTDLRAPLARGFILLEALITIIILAFGLLGLAKLQLRLQESQTESYQRSQATLLLQDMADRLSANRAHASDYLAFAVLGTGDTQPGVCSLLTTLAAFDACEWSNALKGAGEQAGANLGAMVGARGCIEQIGVAPVTYRISVAWEGLIPLGTPSLGCGQNLYGADDRFRRVIATVVPIADLTAP